MKKTKKALSYRSKIHLGVGLVFLIALLLVANKFEEDNLAEIDQSFVSIYEDRLVPATSIFEMRENLYRKREILEKMLHPGHKVIPSPVKSIILCNKNMDSLLTAYKQTYFLDEETNFLLQFESDLDRYNVLETQILECLKQADRRGASKIFEEQTEVPFGNAIVQLSNLNHIQVEIGKDLVVHERSAGASLKVLFRLETGLILLIALIFYILLRQSVIARGNAIDRYHLN